MSRGHVVGCACGHGATSPPSSALTCCGVTLPPQLPTSHGICYSLVKILPASCRPRSVRAGPAYREPPCGNAAGGRTRPPQTPGGGPGRAQPPAWASEPAPSLRPRAHTGRASAPEARCQVSRSRSRVPMKRILTSVWRPLPRVKRTLICAAPPRGSAGGSAAGRRDVTWRRGVSAPQEHQGRGTPCR